MELLKKSYHKAMIRFAISCIFAMSVIGGIIYAVALTSPDELNEARSFFVVYFSFMAFLFLFLWIFLFTRNKKSQKQVSVLTVNETEQLGTLMKAKSKLCNIYFLENHILSIKGVVWQVVDYNNIKLVSHDYTVAKSYGISVSKFYTINLTLKEGKPNYITLSVTKKQYRNDYDSFCSKLKEKNPSIEIAGFNSKIC